MNVLIIGANGQIARKTITKLKEANHQPIAMIRDEKQAETLKQLGAYRTVVGDLEGSFAHAYEEADAVIFAAGSGGHTGGDKTILVDLWGAMKAIDLAEHYGVKRFIMVSSMGTVDPDQSERIKHYLVAKKLADDHLRRSKLQYTIVRPGSLTDEEPTGKIKLEEEIAVRDANITRADVASVLTESLERENTFYKTFEILNGNVPIVEALDKV